MLAKLNEQANSIHHNFNEFEKRVRAEARKAIQDGDIPRWLRLTDERLRAQKAVNELLDQLEDQAMSSAVQKSVSDALDARTQEARDLVAKMKKAGQILDTITEFANLAVAVLGTVKTIVRP